MPIDQGPPPYQVLAALGASLRAELAKLNKSIRLPVHPHRRPAILSHTQLPIHRRQHGLSYFGAPTMLTEDQPWMPTAAR